MVKAVSSKGGFVNIELVNLAATMAFIRAKSMSIKDGADVGCLRAAVYVGEEVQESIMGNRPETKSVLTGRFANSITVNKIKDAEYVVFPEKTTYPGTRTTTQDVAGFMEKKRKHFRNTQARTKLKVRQAINEAIK